ncbi:5128_t:CDS:2, partial [Scutellospora calospora]
TLTMLTLITEESDSYNIDYYYSKYRDHYGIGMSEVKIETLRVLSANINSVVCDASSTKKHHYFKIPTQPQLATCLCDKYHTNFISQFYKISPQTVLRTAPIETLPTISTKRFNRITNKLQTLPLIKQQQQQPIANSKILFPNFNTNPTLSQITPHSQNYHTSLVAMKIAKMTSKEKILLLKIIFPKLSISNSNISKDNISETTIEDKNNNENTDKTEKEETTPNKSTKQALTFD